MVLIIMILMIIFVVGIGGYWLFFQDKKTEKPIDSTNSNIENLEGEESNHMIESMKIKVNNQVLTVQLEQNDTTQALIEKLKEEDIPVHAREYGNFEKVGSLGFSLPTNDTNIKTKPGDVMLYQGNQITIFYGTNTWDYTKIGEIKREEQNQLKTILGSGDVTLVLSIY